MSKINPFIFRTYDIRGIYPKDVNAEVFFKIGFVLGKKKEKFLVSNDIRSSGKILALSLISGLQTAGAKVLFAGTNSFGLCFFSSLKAKVDKTLFITASHLPAEWNGIKTAFGNGIPFSPKMIADLKKEVLAIENLKIKRKKGKIERVNFKNDYLNFLREKFSSLEKNNLKVVLDCGNGTMGLVAPEVFKSFNFKVIELFIEPDPRFPNRPSEPTIESTQKLREIVLREKADFGVAFDGDGDRSVIIDDKGRYLRGSETGTLLGKEILKNSKRKKVIKTISCSLMIEEELKKLDAKIIEVPVGRTFVILATKKEKAILGIEESNHLVLPEYLPFDDAILLPLKIAEVINKSKKRLSQLVASLPHYYFEEVVLECPDEKKFQVMEKITSQLKKNYSKVNTLDGIKVYFKNAWVLIRVSNTSPYIRLYCEAKEKLKFLSIKRKFLNILKEQICKQ